MTDTTQDPHAPRPSKADTGTARVELEVLFAADLARIGARADLGPADRPIVGRRIGRDEPELALGLSRFALSDPCISRRQLDVSWDPSSGVFEVRGDPGARRTVTLHTLDGSVRPPGAPGPTIVAVGDRALLLLTVRRPSVAASSVLGASDAMRALRSRIADVAPRAGVALITGPTGSGKELVARELHAKSGRRGPFVALNAAALPRDLVESELFGHVRGAFSGALQSKDGLFQAAAGGTLLLDEMGELPLALQAKLLRAVELSAVRPVGGAAEVSVDVRTVAATNRDLAEEVAAGRFRADLYQRLLGLHVEVPPLAYHRDDIALLFVTFLRRHVPPDVEDGLFRPASLAPPPLPQSFFFDLFRHPFPGNVRELERIALDVAVRGPDAAVLTSPPVRALPPIDPVTARGRPARDELEAALVRHAHVQHRVARELGVPYATLDRWLRDAGIRRPRDLSPEEIRSAVQAAGTVDAAARTLGVSARGLRLRMAELGL